MSGSHPGAVKAASNGGDPALQTLLLALVVLQFAIILALLLRHAALRLQVAARERHLRRDAVRRSQDVTLGKVTEHLLPYLAGFPFNPKDARFLGSPIDLLVFDGLDEGDLRSVLFVEVKTGRSTLSTRERRVRDAVRAGRVEWLELRPQLDTLPTRT